MSASPFSAAALRGAVDLSALKNRPAPAATGPGASDTSPSGPGEVVEVTDATFQQAVATTTSVAAVLVLYSRSIPESAQFIDVVVAAARRTGGRLRVMTADIETELNIRQAFQVQSVPTLFGLVQARPVPLFGGVYPEDEVATLFGQLVDLATQQGVTGTVASTDDPDAAAASEPTEEPLSPHHDAAFTAIEAGDYAAARTAYQDALAENPQDEEARLGLAQIGLLERTDGVDLAATRAAAAERPDDVDAQLLVADLDVLGGHVEDAFTRLVDLVRTTAGADRDRVRTHLLELFEVVGPADERVRRGRTALMSALF